MTAPDRYTIVVVDQQAGDTFSLTRTPIGTTIEGTTADGHLMSGAAALELLHDVAVDQQLQSMEAGL